MNWDEVVIGVLVFYLKFLAVFSAYHLPELYTHVDPISKDSSVLAKCIHFGKVIGCVAVVAYFIGSELTWGSNGVRTRATLYFIVLVIPALLGTCQGVAVNTARGITDATGRDALERRGRQKIWDKLRHGMSKAEIREILGPPKYDNGGSPIYLGEWYYPTGKKRDSYVQFTESGTLEKWKLF